MTNESTAKAAAAHSALENLRLRLLDLTSRNRLISFRHTKRASLRIVDELPDQLAEVLLADKEMRFKAVPEPSEEELREADYLGPAEDSDAVVELKPYPDLWLGHNGSALQPVTTSPSPRLIARRLSTQTTRYRRSSTPTRWSLLFGR